MIYIPIFDATSSSLAFPTQVPQVPPAGHGCCVGPAQAAEPGVPPASTGAAAAARLHQRRRLWQACRSSSARWEARPGPAAPAGYNCFCAPRRAAQGPAEPVRQGSLPGVGLRPVRRAKGRPLRAHRRR